MYLIFDTETTGFALFNKSPLDPAQPRLVTISALLLSNNLSELATLDFLVKPEGFQIPKEATEIHGISTEKALDEGLEIKKVLRMFLEFADMAKSYVGHNIQYDDFLLQIECGRQNIVFPAKPSVCTMKELTPICKLPKTKGFGFKWPKLIEAYKFCFGTEFERAHSSLADVRATANLFRWLKNKEHKISENILPFPISA